MYGLAARIAASVTLALTALAPSAQAAYTTVSLSAFTNNSLALGEGTYPTGLSTGNQGLNVPFVISGANGVMNSYTSPNPTASGTLDLTSYGLTGQATFYTLLNNIYGTPGIDEYNITISTVQGPSVTFTSIGGADTRDYNQNTYTNTLSPTTVTWFNNGSGQRLDLRQFTLPAAFAADTISGFTITQQGNGDYAVLSGLTFSTTGGVIPVGVPEPTTLAMLGTGLTVLIARRRDQRLS